jgi:hypothetical protein
MSDNLDTNKTSQGDSGTSISTVNQTPDTKSQSQDSAQNKMFTDEQVKELLEKVRSDEKTKVFGKLEELKAAKDKSEKQIEELQNKLSATLNDLDSVRKGKASEIESVANELKVLRENNEKLNKAVEATVSSAAAKIREFEVKVYRERRIREAGVKLEELVVGQSETDIDATIEAAKKREQQLLEEYKKELQKQAVAGLPTPLSPDGAAGRGPSASLTPQNREALASLKGSEYEKRRTQLLNEALEKAGISHLSQ